LDKNWSLPQIIISSLPSLPEKEQNYDDNLNEIEEIQK